MAIATKILKRDAADPHIDGCFHYCGAIRRLNFSKKIMCLDIAHVCYQCERLSKDPRVPHGATVENLVKYLTATNNNGLIFDP